MSGKLVAYYRDDPNPRYGLDLDTQAAAVRIHAHAYDAELIGTYRDIRGVRWRHRPELSRAIAHALKARARLIFPTLEGPFGNAEVLHLLIESGVEFSVCGRPEVCERTLPSFARLALHFPADDGDPGARAHGEPADLDAARTRSGPVDSRA